MKPFKPLHISWYIVSDAVASFITCAIITHQRKLLLDQERSDYTYIFTRYEFFWQSFFLDALFWIVLYAIAGSYNTSLYKKSSLNELTVTFFEVLIGSIMLLFILFLNLLLLRFFLQLLTFTLR